MTDPDLPDPDLPESSRRKDLEALPVLGEPVPSRPPPRPGDHDVQAHLLQLVLTTPTVEAYLDELVTVVESLSTVIAGCGVTLRRDQGTLSVSASNSLAAVVDEVQYELDQGPCLHALNHGIVVAVDDVATERRFGHWADHALVHGVSSSLSIPLQVGGTTVGALNSYSRRSRAFVPAVHDRLLGLAAQAEVMLALVLRAAEHSSVVDQLHAAMQSRSIVDQALGIVMTRQRCTAAEAFALLRSASQSRNRKLVDIAADLIDSATGHPPQRAVSTSENQ